MRSVRLFVLLVAVAIIPLALTTLAFSGGGNSAKAAARADDDTVAVKLLVTVEPRGKNPTPALEAADVQVLQGGHAVTVAGVRPLAGHPLELAVLIDEACTRDVSLRFPELKKFIAGQAPSTQVAVGYLQDGGVNFAQPFTADHEVAAESLHIPLGEMGISPSPYMSLSNLVAHWTGDGDDRREVLIITPGVDLMGDDPLNPYLTQAIADLERAQIPVFAIYADPAGHVGHNIYRVNQAQNQLAELAGETGGEAYFLGPWASVDFSGYLDDFNAKLFAQYEVTLAMAPGKKAGYQNIRLRTGLKNIDLLSSDRV